MEPEACLPPDLAGATITRIAAGTATLDETPTLADTFQRMRAGTLSAGSRDGQWTLGLALVKASAALECAG